MNKKNKLIALSVLSAMSLTSVSPLAINSFSNVIALQGDQTVNKGTVVMNQDTTIKYLDTNTDPADGTQAKDKWGQYTGWTRTYKDGDNASLNGQYNDNEWKEKSKPYKITVNVNYDDLKFYIENHKINEMLAENIKNKKKKESIEKYDYVEIKRTVEPNKLRIEELK